MRMSRSFAFCAMAVLMCISLVTPASAEVPIDPGLRLTVTAEKLHYPSPVIQIVDEVAIAVPMPSSTYPSKVDPQPATLPSQRTMSPDLPQTINPAIEYRLRC